MLSLLTSAVGIGSNSFLETIRQRLYGLLLGVNLFLLLINPTLANFTLGEDDRQMIEVGLSLILLGGVLVGIFAASRAMSKEVEKKTTLVVLAKPVSRAVFVLGKFLGVAWAVSVAMLAWSVVFLATVRHGVMEARYMPWDMPIWSIVLPAALVSVLLAAAANFMARRHFLTVLLKVGIPLVGIALLATGPFGKRFEVQAYSLGFDGSVLAAIALTWMAAVVLTAAALAFSTRLGQVPTLVLTFGLLLGGISSDQLLGGRGGLGELAERAVLKMDQQGTGEGVVTTQKAELMPLGVRPEYRPAERTETVFAVLYGVLPNFNIFWAGDAVLNAQPVPLSYVLRAGVYALTWVVVVLALAIAAFQTREIA